MQGDVAAGGDLGQGGNVVDDAVGEVGRAADDEDRVGVDKAGDAACVDLVGRSRAGDKLHFDLEVLAGLAEGCVCGVGENPDIACVLVSRLSLSSEYSHLRPQMVATHISGSVTPLST